MTKTAEKGLGWRPWLLGQLGKLLFAVIFLLNRIVVHGEEHLIQAQASERPVFLGFWHGRMIYSLWYMRRYRPIVLVSQSSDGDIIAGLLRSWGYKTIRGSSSRGSRRGLRVMMRSLEKANQLMVNAMDGPLGPARVAKAGGLTAAAQRDAVLIPISGAASRCWTFQRSWDRFQVPKPFGQVVIQFGSPLEPYLIDDSEELARLMSQAINETEEQADALTAHLD